MRNLVKYPPEADEIMQALESVNYVFKEREPRLYGDMRPLCLDIVTSFLEENQEQFKNWLDKYNSQEVED